MTDFIPSTNGFGVVTGTSSILAFPNIPARSVRVKAGTPQAIGYIGSFGTATYPVLQGEDTGWTDIDNVSDLFYKGTGSYLHYWYQS